MSKGFAVSLLLLVAACSPVRDSQVIAWDEISSPKDLDNIYSNRLVAMR